jgi:ABC-type Fe3+/spermidine/putrescine transport system ATPase subunit
MNSYPDGLADLRVENLVKKVADFTLQADFTVQVGERVGLLGKSGSGKTTLLRTLAGLESLRSDSDSGSIFLGKKEVTTLPSQAREMGFVFQDLALFSSLSVLENVTFGLRMKNVKKTEREALGISWLERVGLQSKANSSVLHLSGGEKQRVAFIRALIWKPKLILLDEPFTALDPHLRSDLHKQLIELHQLWPAPLILVTHDPFDLRQIATDQMNLTWDPNFPIRRVSR